MWGVLGFFWGRGVFVGLGFFLVVVSILHSFYLHKKKKKSNAHVNFFSLGDGWLLSVTLESSLEVRIVLLWLSSKLIKCWYPKVWNPFSRQNKKCTISQNQRRPNKKLQTHVWKQLQLHVSRQGNTPEVWDPHPSFPVYRDIPWTHPVLPLRPLRGSRWSQ